LLRGQSSRCIQDQPTRKDEAGVTTKPHRDNADAARTAAAASDLPNVRERELRSAAAYDELAARDAFVANKAQAREAAAAARKSINDAAYDDGNE
jgi:hypothetical protein